MNTKITRSLIREYYGIPDSSKGNSVFHYVNKGFTKLTEENSPQTDSTAYIGDINSSVTITGYENGWSFESQYVKGDPVVDDLVEISTKQKIGSDCERELVSIDLTDAVSGESGSYKARLASIAVEATPPAGDPKAVTKLTGTFHQCGNLTFGKFNILTKTFTADVAEE